MNAPWGASGVNYCSDCHRSSVADDPEGPHGSNAEHLLVASIVSDNTSGTPLCDVCHKPSVYWSGTPTGSKYNKHPGTQGQHKRPQGCFACHMWNFASTSGLGVNTIDWAGGNPPSGLINVHGQNRRWVYNEENGLAGTDQLVDNFIDGYIANMDHDLKRCWSEVCKGHSNSAY